MHTFRSIIQMLMVTYGTHPTLPILFVGVLGIAAAISTFITTAHKLVCLVTRAER